LTNGNVSGICNGTAITFNITPSVGNQTVTWTSNKGSITGSTVTLNSYTNNDSLIVSGNVNVCGIATRIADTIVIKTDTCNKKPIAIDDVSSTDEDTKVNINVLVNDSDPDNNTPFSIVINGNPSNGTAVIKTDKTIDYTPSLNFNGTDSFTYIITDSKGAKDTAKVTITVKPINDLPVAIAENPSMNVNQNSGETISNDLATNYSNPDGNTLNIGNSFSSSAGSGVTAGTLGLSISYTPKTDFTGSDTIIFQVCNATGCINDTMIVKVISISCSKLSIAKIGSDVCTGALTLEAKPANPNSSRNSYQWSFETLANKIIGATNQTYSTLIGGTYILSYTNGTCSDSTKITVSYGQSTPTITGTTELTVSSGSGHQWYVEVTGTLRAIAGATSSSYTPIFNGKYSCLISYANCKLMSNTFSKTGLPAGDVHRAGLEMTDTEIWIPETAESSLTAYPNPANSDNLEIRYSSFNDSDIQLMIYTTEGKLLYSQIFERKSYVSTFNLKGLSLPEGIYQLTVIQDRENLTERVSIIE
jgi:hypothetical protein